MKVLEVCLSAGRGGMELYMARTARELARRGHAVLGLIPPGSSAIRDVLDEAGVPWHPCAVKLPELPLVAARRLAALIDAEQVDAVHVHSRRDLPLVALAKHWSRRKPRLVYTVQLKISHSKRDPYHRRIYGQVDALLAITAQLREQIRSRLSPEQRERVRLLYYGIEDAAPLDTSARAALRARHGLTEGRFTVGIFGQKHEGKGQHLLLRALADLHAGRDGPPVDGQALVVGPVTEPAYVERLREQVQADGLEGRVQFVDFVSRPQELMQLCDVVVLATYQETFGLVLIEAMGVGVAVIGSDAGGVPEIIEHERTGLLFRTRNADSLREQLRRLHEDPALRERVADAGRQRVAERFSRDGHYDELEAILRGEWPPEAVPANA